jgi:hypothetical protein
VTESSLPATRTPRRRRFAIAALIVAAAAVVVVAVLVVKVILWLPWLWASLQDTGPGDTISQNPVTFGAPDQRPLEVPSGARQSLTSAGWLPKDDSPTTALVKPGTSGSSRTYADPTGACTVTVQVRTRDLGTGGEYDMSNSLIADFIRGLGPGEVSTGSSMLLLAPAFVPHFEPDGKGGWYYFYEVVRSPFTAPVSGDRGAVQARVFTDGLNQTGVTTAAICRDEASLNAIGLPALENRVGAAW